MATAAQMEANRRNAQKSTGPRTEQGKNRSRLNALDHGCRANVLVLPTEDFGAYEKEAQTWKLGIRPRNLAEEFLVERLISLSWQEKRIDHAQTARLTQRMWHTSVDESGQEEAQVIELSQKLFRPARGTRALHIQRETVKRTGRDEQDGKNSRMADDDSDDEHPARLVHALQMTLTGCEWLLEQWARLRGLLEDKLPWLPTDKLKVVRLLGQRSIDALDITDVAKVYLASHVLLNQGNHAFQEILGELSPEHAAQYDEWLKLRGYHALTPRDAAAARAMLFDIIDRATEKLEDQAGVLRELAEIDARTAAARRSWDDTPEGEAETIRDDVQAGSPALFELLLRIRQTGAELDFATIRSLGGSVSSHTMSAIDRTMPYVANVVTPPPAPVSEPDPPIEANPAREKVAERSQFTCSHDQ